ncbi:MAG: ABC transporter ATP-binding protein [Deltaproteobacteria bacterium]|nr:ABC transporter ATP-binding protein [Deltaproteobacteria bacterium]
MKPLFRLRSFIKPYALPMAVTNLALLAITGLSLVIPRILQKVIDAGLMQGQIGTLAQAALILLGLGLAIATLNLTQSYISERTAAFIGYDLRNAMVDRIQHLPFTFHDHNPSGQLITRGIEDVRAIQNFAGSGLSELIQLFFMAVGVIAMMVSLDARIALIALLPLLPLAIMTSRFGNRVTKLFYHVDQTLGDLSTRLQDNVMGVQVVRAFARESYESERFDESNRKYFAARLRVVREWSKVMPTTALLITLGTILILLFGGQLVIAGQMTIGQIVAFNAYMLLLSGPIQEMTWLVNGASEAAAGAQRVLEILDHEPEIRSPENAMALPTLNGRVEFNAVSLCYEGEKTAALAGIDLCVEPNRIVALIGQTGSGKTSLVNLIPRFYDVTAGAVLVDGVDVRRADLDSLRRQIGIVLQTPLLFSDTIRANIAYGRPEAGDGEIFAAAKAAQAHEFIREFPNGYETIVGERGVTLSGGQRQRVAIARALLLNPRILILDDSTSSVDPQTEKLIQEALEHLMEGRTTFVIAHRLATVRRADLILVMDRGRIVERGTHEELLARGDLYKTIHDLQLQQAPKQREEA